MQNKHNSIIYHLWFMVEERGAQNMARSKATLWLNIHFNIKVDKQFKFPLNKIYLLGLAL